MRLTTKLVLVLLAGLLLLLAVEGWISVRREIEIFESDMERDARVVGLSLQGMFADLWDAGQHKRARQLIGEVNDHAQGFLVRWVPSESSSESTRVIDSTRSIEPTSGQVSELASDLIRSVWIRDGGSALHTYVPVRAGSGDALGTLEIIESREILSRNVQTTVLRRLILVFVLLLLSAVAVILAGVAIVGRPLQVLIDSTRRIGAGDLTATVQVSGHGEIDELAGAMNTMVGQLRASREELLAETERRIAASEQLRHADRLRTVGRLASGVAHELGTPLNIIGGRASMIEKGQLTGDEITENAQIIHAQIDRVTQIVRQLLDFARRPRTKRTLVDLPLCAAEVHRLLEPLAAKRHISLILDEAGNAPPVMADRSQVEQVLTNLIINAIQASSSGGRVDILVGAETVEPPLDQGGSSGLYAMIQVRDQGSGIPEDAIQHLFEPFFTTKGVGEGTGLGLSVAYSIVQEHGGWIDVQNRDGGGAEFTVYLPEARENGK